MATEKQIAANRANAKRSTGPRTLAGKLKSSRNAYRHGLSAPRRSDTAMSAQTEVIVRALIDGDENEEKLRAAAEFAAAHLELLRIRSLRADLMAKIELAQPDIQELQRKRCFDRTFS
jgi:hypothetical protein